MAKDQGLSLNPTKISGTCGRLMCCLKYENDAYQELIRQTPPGESLVDTPYGRGTVMDASLLRGTCRVRMMNSPDAPVTLPCSQCTVLRRGRDKGEPLDLPEPPSPPRPDLPAEPEREPALPQPRPQQAARLGGYPRRRPEGPRPDRREAGDKPQKDKRPNKPRPQGKKPPQAQAARPPKEGGDRRNKGYRGRRPAQSRPKNEG